MLGHLENIRDCNGHLVCKVNRKDGLIETAYRQQVVSTKLPIGGSITIERNGTRTTVTRPKDTELIVTSREITN